MINFLIDNELPFVIILTKADKLNKSELEANLDAYKKRLLEDWEELPPIFITSSEKKVGREEILDYIDQQNAELDDMKKTKGL